jgi:hypothetical protein
LRTPSRHACRDHDRSPGAHAGEAPSETRSAANTLAWDGTTPDTTRVEVFTSSGPSVATLQPLNGLGLGVQELSIPYGMTGTVQERTFTAAQWSQGQFTQRYLDSEAWVMGVRAHAHLLARSVRITLNRGLSNERILLDIPDWDFHWQGSWQLQTPIALRASDRLTLSCTYDNTTAQRMAVGLPDTMRTVTRGEGTADEMCGGGLELVDALPFSMSADAGAAPSDAGTPCNALMPTGTPVALTTSNQPLPVGVGGVVANGTYVLEALTRHDVTGTPGPTAFRERAIVEVTGDTWQLAVEEPTRRLSETKTFNVTGNRFEWVGTCPTPVTLRGTFTATDAGVTLFYTSPAGSLSRALRRVGP